MDWDPWRPPPPQGSEVGIGEWVTVFSRMGLASGRPGKGLGLCRSPSPACPPPFSSPRGLRLEGLEGWGEGGHPFLPHSTLRGHRCQAECWWGGTCNYPVPGLLPTVSKLSRSNHCRTTPLLHWEFGHPCSESWVPGKTWRQVLLRLIFLRIILAPWGIDGWGQGSVPR